ncbi:MAG: M48 family metalloprotease [Candidatus Aminicenantes bacterium]|nr:M48 family metalloprotease [Candidatus Aminicenantes bacterium]
MTTRMKALGSFALAAILALTGCQAVKQGAADIIASTGKVSQKDAQALVKTAEVLRSTFSDITEEEEYYIGRATAALILAKYKPYRNEALNAYVNTMGTALSYCSNRPEIYAGYHFLVLDTDEVNAMAAPGGFIFVTKGLVRRCGDEETLAAILAHEIGHVAERHGLQSIKKSRLIEAFKVIGSEASQRLDSEELTKLTGLFEGVLGDVVETLVERGYDRKFEYEADKLALSFAVRTGYSPDGLAEFLKDMEENKPSGPAAGWFKTHPSPADRLARVKAEIAALGAAPAKLDVRTARFAQAVKNVH